MGAAAAERGPCIRRPPTTGEHRGNKGEEGEKKGTEGETGAVARGRGERAGEEASNNGGSPRCAGGREEGRRGPARQENADTEGNRTRKKS